MKKANFLNLTFLLACFAASTGLFAQDLSVSIYDASVSPELLVTIDSDAEMADSYTAGISHLSFKSDLHAVKFFRAVCDNLVCYEADYATKTVKINLYRKHLRPDQQWGIAEWNAYLATNQSRMNDLYLRMQQ